MQQDDFRTRRARELRREMTPTEKRLWSQLRGRRFAGYKFRRQTPIAGYVVNFYCAQAHLILELDGESHVGKKARDANREQTLQARGFRIVRIWDTQIYDDLEAVMEFIWRECEALTTAPLTPNPSPPRGEGRKSPSPPAPLP